MIPVWIIEELTRREEKRKQEEESRRERLELPLSSPRISPYPPKREEEPPMRGTIVIEF